MPFTIRILVVLTTITVNQLFAQNPGDLDADFGIGGKVITSVGTEDDRAQSVLIQPDGKIVATGYSDNGADTDFALTRYHSNGLPDNSFGSNGKLSSDFMIFDNVAYTSLVQPDGKIVVGGYAKGSPIYYAVARYHENGTLDTDFGNNGFATLDNDLTGTGAQYVRCLAIQPDLKIVASGEFWLNGAGWQIAVVRYNVDGTLDSSFGTSGRVIPTPEFQEEGAFDLAIQPDGKILIAGYSYETFGFADFVLIRLNPDGSFDNDFGTDGKVIADIENGNDEAHSI